VRTGTVDIHKTAKSYFLNGGRFVDGWKNAQNFASQGKEDALKKYINHYEILEAERKAKLKIERTALISDYCENPEFYPLGEMTESSFNQLLEGLKLAKTQKEEDEKRAEEERLAKIEAERIENERIRAEAERLRLEAIEREKQIEAERIKQAAILKAQQDAAEAAARIEAEKQAKIQAELRAEAEKQKIERERIEKIEREKREQLEAELRAKAENEAKIEAEKQAAEKARIEAEKKAAKAPDKTKLTKWVDELPKIDVTTISMDAIGLAQDLNAKFEGFKKWAKSEIEKL